MVSELEKTMGDVVCIKSVLSRSGTPGAYDLNLLHQFGGAPVAKRTWLRYGEVILSCYDDASEPTSLEYPVAKVDSLPPIDTLALDAMIEGTRSVAYRVLRPRIHNAMATTNYFFELRSLAEAIERGDRVYHYPVPTVYGKDRRSAEEWLHNWCGDLKPHEARHWAAGLAALARQIEADFPLS